MKKFITIALAVAVLFSFAACQAEYKQVTGITVSYNGGDVLTGQAFDPSQFSGTVTYLSAPDAAYTGGYVISTQNGTAAKETTTYVEGTNVVVPAGYDAAGYNGKGIVVTGASVYAYTPTKVIVDVSDATTEIPVNATSNSVPLDGVTVTAIYNGGKEMELDISYIEATVSSAASKADNQKVTVALASEWSTAWDSLTPTIEGVDGDWTVNVVEGETVKITGITLAAKTLYVGQNAKNEDWTVTATYSDNTTKVLEVSGYGLTFVEGVTGASSAYTYGTVGTTVSAYATVITTEGNIYSNLESGTVEDYISTVAIVAKDSDTAVTSVEYSTKSTNPLAALTATGARLKVTTAGGTSTYNAVTGIEFSVPYLSNNTTTGESVTWTYPQEEGAPAMTTATGTISFKYVPQA